MRWRFDYLEDFEVVLKQVCDNFWIQIWDLDEYEIWVTWVGSRRGGEIVVIIFWAGDKIWLSADGTCDRFFG